MGRGTGLNSSTFVALGRKPLFFFFSLCLPECKIWRQELLFLSCTANAWACSQWLRQIIFLTSEKLSLKLFLTAKKLYLYFAVFDCIKSKCMTKRTWYPLMYGTSRCFLSSYWHNEMLSIWKFDSHWIIKSGLCLHWIVLGICHTARYLFWVFLVAAVISFCAYVSILSF